VFGTGWSASAFARCRSRGLVLQQQNDASDVNSSAACDGVPSAGNV
jgi:hypothetical protein